MAILQTILWVIEIISALSVIILVLLQHGKGADVGATFGSGGGSGSLFGSSGSSNFLSHTTAIFAAVFFLSTFAIVLISNGRVGDAGVMSGLHGKVVASGTANLAKTSSATTSSLAASAAVKTNSSKPSNNPNQKNQMPN